VEVRPGRKLRRPRFESVLVVVRQAHHDSIEGNTIVVRAFRRANGGVEAPRYILSPLSLMSS